MKLWNVSSTVLGIGATLALLTSCGSPYNSSYNSPRSALLSGEDHPLSSNAKPSSTKAVSAALDFDGEENTSPTPPPAAKQEADPIPVTEVSSAQPAPPVSKPLEVASLHPEPASAIANPSNSRATNSEPAVPFAGEAPTIPNLISSLALLRMPTFLESWGIRRDLYEKVEQYYNQNRQFLKNPDYVSIVDFSKRSSEKRFYIVDLRKGRVIQLLTTHGTNSDPQNTGLATLFSNTEDSLQSSLGFFVTLDSYEGENGYSLRLRGLEATNSNAEKRNIVIHSAPYVNEDLGRAGRSWGCLALDPKVSRSVINHLMNGSLLFIGK